MTGRPRTVNSPLKIEEWPDRDQVAWDLACGPSDPFSYDRSYSGAELSPQSLCWISTGYGRWLRFLTMTDCLDPNLSPLERVTPVRLASYFRELKSCGNADWTIIGRFSELRRALRMFSPGQDVSWIVRPYGLSVYAALPKATRQILVPDGAVLFRWGIGMMNDADSTTLCGMARFRDGLMIAMLAARARRRRSMLALRPGKELFRDGQCYRVELAPTQVKTKKADRFNLPIELTSYIDRYLKHVRPCLMRGAFHEELWITRYGTPMSEQGLSGKIHRLTKKRFGVGFGPHRFRHAVATTLTLHAPDTPGLAAAVLGISADVASAHYIRAGQIEASEIYGEIVDRRRSDARRARV